MAAIYLAHTRRRPLPRALRVSTRAVPQRGCPRPTRWIPFGGGTRRCIGAAFAQLEMRVVLRTVLAQAELRPATDRAEPIVRRNVTLSPRNGTPAILVSRQSRSREQALAG